MIGSNKLQDDLLAREEARIKAKREANEQRRVRYLNAKVRLIGLDIQSLDQQVEEKQRQREQERETDRFHRLQALEVERVLAQAAEEERQMKDFQRSQMKRDWDNAVQYKREHALSNKEKDFDLDRCGPSSALRFAGEDVKRKDRVHAQKEQMRRWIQEQVAEKAQLQHLQKEEEMSYAEMIRAIDEIRANAENEERELRQYILNSNKDYNKELGATQRERNRTLNKVVDEPGKQTATSLDLFNEDKTIAVDEHGRVVRRDMFKGFTEEQKKQMTLENQNVIRAKMEEREAERKNELDWAIHQVLTLRAMEEAEYEEKAVRENENKERYAFLKQQMEEQKYSREEWSKTKNGDVGTYFYDKFGKSCR